MPFLIDTDGVRWRRTPREPNPDRRRDAGAETCQEGARAAQQAGAHAEGGLRASRDALAALAGDRSRPDGRDAANGGAARQGTRRGRRRAAERLNAEATEKHLST